MAVYTHLGLPVGDPLPTWKGASPVTNAPMNGRKVRLEPLSQQKHGEDLRAAFDDDKEGKMWTYLPIGPFNDDPEGLNKTLLGFENHSDMAFFTIIDKASDKARGVVAYMRDDSASGVVEVGYVTLSPKLQGTVMSTEFQYLMMRRVFEESGYRRYEWKCDSRNAASRKAAARLGFNFEGTFRQAAVYKGRSRDTSWFSILDSEWPALKIMFESWLDASNFDSNGEQIKSLQAFNSDLSPDLNDRDKKRKRIE
eukprot:TRINITY_DN15353_c0_g1_i1.p1 TRINITY_DN15353_c0_g1~~TRINITY_DN15353_c0_g1_i1.p1  ORF type:complete len:264 (-),score=46.94 TRINITY_DN15353_c0_g1_i1:72-830(-)